MAIQSVVSSLMQKIRVFLVEEAKFLYRVGDEVKQLEVELRRLQAFLIDAETKKHRGSKRVQTCVAEIREATYDADDVLDTYILQLAYPFGTRDFIYALSRFFCCLSEIISLHSVGSEIERITERFVKIRESMQDYGVLAVMDAEVSNSWKAGDLEVRQSFGHEIEHDIVGIEHEIVKLTSILVDETRNVPIISICGMGGLGKTTLAKQVFHNSKVRGCFDAFAWVYVSQQCRRRRVWQEILISLHPDSKHTILDMADEQLSEELYGFLKSKKSLVVIDDVWSLEDWNVLCHGFPDKTGSKMILTSRIEDVASYTRLRGLVHRPRCLTDDESWELLQKIVFFNKDMSVAMVDERMEELGKRMVKRCGGLPLAIKALGGILATKHSSADWLRIEMDLTSYFALGNNLEQNNSSVLSVLSLSYDVLPYHLKACFLYLGHFPEDCEIDVDRLIKYWTAEGMVVGDGQETGENRDEDLAERYIDELVKRNMVLVGRRDVANLKIKTCRLHDLIRELCLSKAKDDIYQHFTVFHSRGEQRNHVSPLPVDKVRRLWIHLDKEFSLKYLKAPWLRSLLFFKGSGYRKWFLFDATFKNLRMLRVLDLESAEIQGRELPEDIGELIHLRYLSLRRADVKSLPASVGNLKMLLTLDIRSCYPTVHVPNVLWKLRRLRHLYLPSKLSAKTKLDIGCLEELQTLENFPLGKYDVRALFSMTRLRTLSIYMSSRYNLSGTIVPAVLGNILKHLHVLTIQIDWHLLADRGWPAPPVDASKLLPGFVNLRELNLFTKIGNLPDANHLPQDVSSIALERCNLEEDPLPILGKLLSLRVLKLSDEAFVRITTAVCCAESFPQLVHLELRRLSFLEEWRIEDGSMPRLGRLAISGCQQLKMLPEGIRFLASLQQVDLVGMPESFMERLVQGGVDFYKIQHVASLKFPSRHQIVTMTT